MDSWSYLERETVVEFLNAADRMDWDFKDADEVRRALLQSGMKEWGKKKEE